MKALFIAFDQAHYEDVYNVLTHNNCRGFTRDVVRNRENRITAAMLGRV